MKQVGKIYGISMIYHQGFFMWSNEEFFILFGLQHFQEKEEI